MSGMVQYTIRLDHTARDRHYQMNSNDCNRAISEFSMDLDSLASVLELYLAPEARSASQTATLEKVHGSKVRLDTTNLVQLRDLMTLESTLQSSDTSDRNLGATSSSSQRFMRDIR